jgi:hypothetical protein
MKVTTSSADLSEKGKLKKFLQGWDYRLINT